MFEKMLAKKAAARAEQPAPQEVAPEAAAEEAAFQELCTAAGSDPVVGQILENYLTEKASFDNKIQRGTAGTNFEDVFNARHDTYVRELAEYVPDVTPAILQRYAEEAGELDDMAAAA